jgi:hypothetical protein
MTWWNTEENTCIPCPVSKDGTGTEPMPPSMCDDVPLLRALDQARLSAIQGSCYGGLQRRT